ncbi:ArsR/SmtB family transcription factor [Streptomyces sp. NPDC020965]|uniref:ArsR/SmtB family transcription factor n=1 Tax=Streptomyces sp. NPDC020965 TaxID=3365105 RepID=UPI00379B2CA8
MAVEPPVREIADLATLKALSHPRRYQIFQQLALLGSATSAMLARELDLNTGATSYHLRELARHGFIEETRTDESGRERWWRTAPADLRFPERSKQSAEIRPVVDEMNRRAYAADIELFERLRQQSEDPTEWMDAFRHARSSLRLTLDELHAFFEEYIALVNRYKRPDGEAPDGTRTVLTRLFTLPAPDTSEPRPATPPRVASDSSRKGPDPRADQST